MSDRQGPVFIEEPCGCRVDHGIPYRCAQHQVGSGTVSSEAERTVEWARAQREKNLAISSLTPVERSALNDTMIIREDQERTFARLGEPQPGSWTADHRGDEKPSSRQGEE